MRIVFKPIQTEAANPAETVNELLFVGVAHDDGTPIPDDKLKWMADGDHEALCVECLIGMNPAPTLPSVPPGQAVAWLHTMHMELNQKQRRVTFSASPPFGKPGKDYSEEFTVTSEALGVIANPGDVDPNAGRSPTRRDSDGNPY